MSLTGVKLILWPESLGISAGVLVEAALFYVVALILLTYLGMGVSAILLPGSLRPVGWLMTPYLGFSVLTIVSAWMVAFGADVRASLLAALALSTLANLWVLSHGRKLHILGSPKWWLAIPALALPSYAITAISAAHNGSLAYVGGQGDLYLLLPLAEWLKNHPDPLFSLGSASWLNPYWNANVPPIGGWSMGGAHLDYAGHRFDDTNFLFQRGSIYLQSSVGLLLGWDTYLLFRPTQAFVLSLALPATFLFCRQLVRASTAISTLATLLVGLNGSIFYWVAFGHPGQSVGLMLFPVVTLAILSAIQSEERLPPLGAALLLSALLISYYQGAPLLIFLLAPGLLHLMCKTSGRRGILARTALVGTAVLLIALPEHVKLALVYLSGTLVQTSGAGDLALRPLGDGLGTTVDSRVLNLVAGQGQIGEVGLALLRHISSLATALAILLALVGITFSRVVGIGLYRAILLGAAVLLLGLALARYYYGYAKALSCVAFLLATALALGAGELWHRTRNSLLWQKRTGRPKRALAALIVGTPLLITSATIAINMSLAAFAFWKPVGNIWNPKAWEASALTDILPPNTTARLSPNIVADPESYFATLYFLRNQRLQGPFTLEGPPEGKVMLLGTETAGGEREPPTVEILGANEIAPARGLTPSDQIWTGPIVNAYSRPSASTSTIAVVRSASGEDERMPARLPTVLEIRPGEEQPGIGQWPPSSQWLLLTLAAENPTEILVATNAEKRTLQIGTGVSVRSIAVECTDRVTLDWRGDSPVWLLASSISPNHAAASVGEDYPRVVAAIGTSTLREETISTHFAYLNVLSPVSHSLDLFDSKGVDHPGWFQLPMGYDGHIRDVRFDLHPGSMGHRLEFDGVEMEQPYSSRQLGDGEYGAYLSVWKHSVVIRRVPLYRFRLKEGRVTAFEPFDLAAVWSGMD